jgi:hypothetical protein
MQANDYRHVQQGRMPPAVLRLRGKERGRKLLCVYSVAGFRDNLVAKHPDLRTAITTITSKYE